MTLTELYDQIANLINKAMLPFDAKVFVVRSIHNELESEYNRYRTALQAAKEREQGEKGEKQT